MIDVEQILYEITNNKNVFDPNFDLIESNVLDSYNFIELLSILEDNGISIHPTRIDKELLRTTKGIKTLIEQSKDNK